MKWTKARKMTVLLTLVLVMLTSCSLLPTTITDALTGESTTASDGEMVTISKEEYERRVNLLREAIKTKTVTYNWHDSDTSFLEAVLARGDRRMGKVLETAWRKGAKLDAWEEYFSLDRWLEAFDQCGLDPHFYANRTREKDELMPWAMISSGVTESYLWRERERAFAGVTTPDCRTHCNACGANRLVGGKCDV